MKITLKTLKNLVNEVLKEQLARSGASYTGPGGGTRDVYVGGGAAPSEAAERAELVRLGYMTPEGRLTPNGRTHVSGLIDRHARAMVERYRATGAMPSEGDASLGRLGLGGMEASAHNQAVRRAHAMIRGMGLEGGAARAARRSGSAPAPAGSSLEDLMARATGGREADIAGMAAGAVRPGSALPATRAATPVVPLATRMAAVAAERRRAAERAPAADRIPTARSAAVPPLPPARPTTSSPGEDPLAGINPLTGEVESDLLSEMIRKAVKEAISKKKK